MVKQTAEFKHQSVRDLAWAIASPPLIVQPSGACRWPQQSWFEQVYEDRLSWLNTLDQDPAELEELLAGQKDRRLGKYFETLWYYWFDHHPRYQIIENNLQIIIDGETLGEMDLIVFDKFTKKTVHWELAVKFYLGVSDTRDLSHWYGPNLNDRLERKVHNLVNKQSVISQRERVPQWLKKQGVLIDETAVILKGRLYYPWQFDINGVLDKAEACVNSPAICAPSHLRGVWCTEATFDLLFDKHQLFLPLKNSGWMESISTYSVKKYYTKDEVFETLSNNMLRLPLQVQVINPRHSWGRAFIVGENWPQKNI